jgi:hypothetical protein
LPLETAIRRMTAALLPDGWFAAALMTEGTLGELHRLRADLSPGNIPTAKLPSLEGVCRAVRSAGLRLESARELALESEHASAGALLADLHATGVTGGRYSMGARPLTRGELARLKERYQSQYGDRNGRVRASWRVALVIARPGFKS